ncbi:hypothetical protein AAF712_002491 [Marasmius tenuissimus]|uniref:Uncharacterized protein n=1 Tax=Marasmius tenuissimus TaxID=585030 RepID=A0ABR3AAE9_9AGAR
MRGIVERELKRRDSAGNSPRAGGDMSSGSPSLRKITYANVAKAGLQDDEPPQEEDEDAADGERRPLLTNNIRSEYGTSGLSESPRGS